MSQKFEDSKNHFMKYCAQLRQVGHVLDSQDKLNQQHDACFSAGGDPWTILAPLTRTPKLTPEQRRELEEMREATGRNISDVDFAAIIPVADAMSGYRR